MTSIDYWGKKWDYSKSVCEHNAQVEGIGDHLEFQKASASELPFPDESFNLAVNNLVFHEVSQVKDKRQLVREGLRVVRKGGHFAFQDPFLIEAYYGKPGAIHQHWSKAGASARWNSSKPAMRPSSPGCSSWLLWLVKSASFTE